MLTQIWDMLKKDNYFNFSWSSISDAVVFPKLRTIYSLINMKQENKFTELKRHTLMAMKESTKSFDVVSNLFEDLETFYYEGFLGSCVKAHHYPTEKDNNVVIGMIEDFLNELLTYNMDEVNMDAKELAKSYYTLFLLGAGVVMKSIA